ncbi:Fasciclin domain-containing protein [Endogone sp. FLAS-F59071]|nr:Fasciclin domain-containing protein [Endogone sp. FLAS-F59071]|eukprot:RUS22888.1 Fasciclin domain-containing protein [Endogone sp. FLAS-F59071]
MARLLLLLLLVSITTAQLVPIFDFSNITDPALAKALSDLDSATMTTPPASDSSPTPFIVFQGTDDYTSPSEDQSLLDLLPRDQTLSTFLDILMQVEDIVKIFSDPTQNPPLTVFAPTNSALKHYFDKEGGRVILRDKAKMRDFLQYHIAPVGKVPIAELKKRRSIRTMLRGQELRVGHNFITDKIKLNSHAVVNQKEQTEAVNGVAYRIDAVLTLTE